MVKTALKRPEFSKKRGRYTRILPLNRPAGARAFGAPTSSVTFKGSAMRHFAPYTHARAALSSALLDAGTDQSSTWFRRHRRLGGHCGAGSAFLSGQDRGDSRRLLKPVFDRHRIDIFDTGLDCSRMAACPAPPPVLPGGPV